MIALLCASPISDPDIVVNLQDLHIDSTHSEC